LDPPVFLGVRALVVVTALLAAWVPAARAFRVEPAVTLEAD